MLHIIRQFLTDLHTGSMITDIVPDGILLTKKEGNERRMVVVSKAFQPNNYTVQLGYYQNTEDYTGTHNILDISNPDFFPKLERITRDFLVGKVGPCPSPTSSPATSETPSQVRT